MVKRKAEGNPCIESKSKVCTPEWRLPEDLSNSELNLTTDLPTGGEHREGTPVCHMDPASAKVDEGS